MDTGELGTRTESKIDEIRVRITSDGISNTSHLDPGCIQVEMVTKQGDIDLTMAGIVQWPIQIEITERGAFAILKIPIEAVDIGRIRS